MFTIDLLKNQGIPKKSKPIEVALAAIALLIPVILIIALAFMYLGNNIDLGIKQNELTRLENQFKPENESENTADHAIVDAHLADVAYSIGYYDQWTTILEEMTNKMPPSIILTELKIVPAKGKIRVPDRKDPEKQIDKEIINRTIRTNLLETASSKQQKDIQNYIFEMNTSPKLTDTLKDVQIVKNEESGAGKIYVVDYELKTEIEKAK